MSASEYEIAVQCRELATPSRELYDMAKKRKPAARKRATRKPAARRRRASNPDSTINALVILVVIVMVLGGLYLYVQNKKQAALFPGLMNAVVSLIPPQLASAVQILRPTATAEAPETTASVLTPLRTAPALEPAAGAETPQPVAAVEMK